MRHNFSFNVDDELKSKFEELFGKDSDYPEKPKSEVLAKMENIKIARAGYTDALNEMAAGLRKPNRDELFIPSRNSLVVADLQHYDAENGMEYGYPAPIPGKHFTWINPPGMKTIAYRVEKWHVDVATETHYYDVQFLEYGVTSDGNEQQQIFFVDCPEEEEELVFITCPSDGSCAYVNMGILSGSTVKIADKPIYISFQALSWDNPPISPSTHKGTEQDNNENCAEWFEARLDARIVLIDPVACEPVLREMYYDEEQEEWKSKVRLFPYKSYFAFEIRDKNSGENSWKLTLFELGMYYRFGVQGFPCDNMLAAWYFEKDNSPEGWYQIAGIFLENGEFHDEILGLEYLEKSAFAGCHAAMVDLAIWYYYHDKEKLTVSAELIKRAMDDEYPPALFIAAYSYEKGIVVERYPDNAFELYFKAAELKYAPAIRRLSYLEGIDAITNKEQVRNNFLSSLKDEIHYTSFCLGGVLLGKVYMETSLYGREYNSDFYLCINEREGAKLILDSAEHGCKNAFLSSAENLDYGLYGFEVDKQKSLKYYEQLTDLSMLLTIKVSSRFLDGIGCEPGEEADKEAYDLLFSLIKDGKGPQKAMHNLGWMHFFGRGCDVNYELAKMFFETAKMGSSYYYLGKIHEDGLVGDADITLAIECYEKGAELENEKCIQRLSELNASDGQSDAPKLSTEEKIDLIYGAVMETNERTKLIADNLSSVRTFIKDDLSGVLREAKSQIRDSTVTVELDKLPDETIAAFVEKMSKYINQNTKSFEVLFTEETKHLSSLFGQAWGKLLPTSRTSLISAGVLWKSCAEIKDDKDFDFSGICISATSALENELKRYFYIGFQRYLEKTYGSPSAENWEETFRNWPEAILSTTKYEYERALKNPDKFKKPILGVGTNFTLGSMPFLLGAWRGKNMSNDQFSLLLNRMEEYLQTVVKESYQQDARIAFVGNGKDDSLVNKCERIRREYRNKAAHIDVITRKQAENCYRAVIGKIDAYDHTANVTSALLELFSILK